MASYPFLSQAPTPVEVELGCDNLEVNWSVQRSCADIWERGTPLLGELVIISVEIKSFSPNTFFKDLLQKIVG